MITGTKHPLEAGLSFSFQLLVDLSYVWFLLASIRYQGSWNLCNLPRYQLSMELCLLRSCT